MKPYSIDLRERAVTLLAKEGSSIAVAGLLDVSDGWVRKMRIRLATRGNLAPGTPPGKARMLSPEDEERLALLAIEVPDATLQELADLAAKRMKIRMSISTISRRLIEMGLTRKKRASTPPKGTARTSKSNVKRSANSRSSPKPRGSSSLMKRG